MTTSAGPKILHGELLLADIPDQTFFAAHNEAVGSGPVQIVLIGEGEGKAVLSDAPFSVS
ncbi:hypothetical protein [Streptomyces sp. SS1-1]|uniref:hypothetical protein n=1 Tax=Streptomyces sp. SS1-1 TaxID=2651869 RepID=UPI00178C2E9F|nr:hypothetical protein [Streptomyces sp. SS1-1]